jgi:hypothetical protein
VSHPRRFTALGFTGACAIALRRPVFALGSVIGGMLRRVSLKQLSEPLTAIARCSSVAKFVALGIGDLGNVAKIGNIFAVCVGILPGLMLAKIFRWIAT